MRFPLCVGRMRDGTMFSPACALPFPASVEDGSSLFGWFTGITAQPDLSRTFMSAVSNCGSLRFQTPKARLQSSSGLFLNFSRVAANAKITELLPACRPSGNQFKVDLST